MNENLTQAANIIEAYIAMLNNEQSICECCGLVKYENFRAHQQFEELTAVVRKLQKFAKADPVILVD